MPKTDDVLPFASLLGPQLAASQRHVSPLAGRRLNGFSEELAQPLLLGYLRRDLLVVDSQIDQLKQDMTAYAEAEHFTMGHIYVEKRDNWLAAFEGLAESIDRDAVTAVVLPSLLHIIGLGLGTPSTARSLFEQATGARILVLTP